MGGRGSGAFRWIGTIAIAISILYFSYAAFSIYKNVTDPLGIDFVSFWAAGSLATDGKAELAYDVVAHREVERTAGPMKDLMPFPYPPPFLLAVYALGFLPFVLAFGVWIAAFSLIFYVVFRQLVPDKYVFAFPAGFPNILVGQNGMLTTSIFYGGMALLERRQWLAGAIIGALVIKPQLAALIPLAFLAGGYWRAIAGAALSAVGLLLVALLAFGPETYAAFFAIIPQQAALLSGAIPWPKVASLYGALRTIGLPATPALLLHAALALWAATLTWLAWSRRYATRIPLLAAASLLVSPYLFNYDSVWLMVPVGWLIVHQRRPAAIIAIWAISFAALFAMLPNPTFIAASLAVWLMWVEGRRGVDAAVEGAPTPAPGSAAPAEAVPGTP